MIYFCFKCRRRVTATDPQFQCLNQQCQYYGKLLCEVCTTAVPEYKNQAMPHYKEGVLGWIVGAAACIGIASWIIFSFGVGFGIFVGTLIVGGIVAVVKGKPFFERTTYTSQQVQSGYHRECIACHQSVEVLHD
jgi:predicted lipid-binding transport protein (Tim44 family)